MPFILGTKIDDISLDQALVQVETLFRSKKRGYVVTPNPEICLYAAFDEKYRREVLHNSLLSLPDGFGLKIGAWILGERLKNRVTGIDFTEALMERAAGRGWRVFLFGAEGGVARDCKKILEQKYPGLIIVGTKSGIIKNHATKSHGSSKNCEEIIKHINARKPDILLVALGAPRQEKWIAKNLPHLKTVSLFVGVGGTFDFIAGRVKRAPKVLRTVGFEWFWRLIKQPWRIRRIYRAVLKFTAIVLYWRMRMVLRYRPNVVGLFIRFSGGGSSAVERLLPKQKIAGSIPVHRSIEILLVERADESGHWQLPQGGVDKGENAQDAIMREMQEELGVKNFRVLFSDLQFYKYHWPRENRLQRGFKGQIQDLFILEFADPEVTLDLDKREHQNYQWVPRERAVQMVHQVRQDSVKKAIATLNSMF